MSHIGKAERQPQQRVILSPSGGGPLVPREQIPIALPVLLSRWAPRWGMRRGDIEGAEAHCGLTHRSLSPD